MIPAIFSFPRSKRVAAWITAWLCFVCTGLAQAGPDVFRCIEAGHVTYSDRDCGGERSVVALVRPDLITPSSATAASMAGPRFAEDRVVDESLSPVALGMSPRRVLLAMGRPIETRATLQGRTLVEYWFYRGADGRTRIAFQEGRVTGVYAH